MPRGQKSKSRSRAKRHQARGDSQEPLDVHSTAEEEAASPPVSQGNPPRAPDVSTSQGNPLYSPDACISQESQGIATCGSPDAGVSSIASGVGAEGSDADTERSVVHAEKKISNPSQAAASTHPTHKDPFMKKTGMLVEFLLDKFKMKEPVTQDEMLKIVNKKYKQHFSEILRRVSARLELVFGLELKEVDPNTHSYVLVGKLGLSTEGSLIGIWGLPKTGLLMLILGVIFMKGNRATEQEIWQFLNGMGIRAGKKHLIYGDPGEFITKDLVQENYLEYCQVPGSDPPCYEFIWGPRAHAETTKMKVLELLAKINGTTASAFPNLYKLALRDQAKGEGRSIAAHAGTVGKARVHPKATSNISSHK
uniref:melanoma-associated antigen B2-like n=1 Tax=Jaculus jaculus TaxID=51337 RepID=UPI001E1B517D|nr:melanoma-associated antigen B2-like [Jaculus jaculus]